MNFKCKKCGSDKYFTKSKNNGTGTAIGLYCAKCGQWQKWLNKQERNLYEAPSSPQEMNEAEEIVQMKKENAQLRRALKKACGCIISQEIDGEDYYDILEEWMDDRGIYHMGVDEENLFEYFLDRENSYE